MSADLFTSDYKDQPYWWDRTPRPDLPEIALPERVDVAVIGSGFTGLNAAIQTARGGRETLVLDAEAAGWGCSTRNGGQISTSLKPSYDALAAKLGAEKAFAILKEGHNALEWIGDFVESEGIDCDFERAGRFYMAHNPVAYDKLGEKFSKQAKGLEVPFHMVPKAEQHREIGSDFYHGGVVLPRHASLDPARYHQGLLERATAAGATVIPNCRVTGFERDGQGFRIATARGRVQARDLVVASNGYTGAITPWLRRRVIPIGSYIIATEPLPEEQMDRLIPNNRVLTDTRKLVYYYRASPDRTRILFGGRVSLKETDPKVSAPKLHADMVEIFPELAGTKVSHSWVGFVAYTFDEMPHIGRHEGAYYAMGYCGSGVSLASYFGMRLGQQVLGLKEGKTGLDELAFQTRPLYQGDPWFLAYTIGYYRWRDRQNR